MDSSSTRQDVDAPRAPGRAIDEIQPGTLIDGHEVLRLVARGGEGQVLVVRHVSTHAVRAMKVLHGAGEHPGSMARFRREFRVLQRLAHPNVVHVEAWGLYEGRPWYTMELVDGTDLRKVLPAWDALPWPEREARVRAVLVELGRALAWIHGHGLVHRDVSPGNILVDPDGHVKLVDFGLVTEGVSAEGAVGEELLATLAHAAPERLRGLPVDGRADLYSLGTVLYQMLTGSKPFVAHTVAGWLEQHAHGTPRPPREVDPRVPEDLDQVCLRLLEKDPDRRFASARHLLRVLGDVDASEDASGWPPREVGRVATAARIGDLLDEIAAGRPGGALLLTGPSGIGKTRMLDLAEREAARRGLRVVRDQCRTHDRAFGPFAEIYARLGVAEPPGALVRAFRGDAEASRYRIGAAYRKLLRAAAPCVVVVDQVERAEPATRELVDYLVRTVVERDAAPVLLVFAAELAEGIEPPVAAGAERHALQPLSVVEVEEVVSSLLHDPDEARRLATVVHEETGGLPAWTADVLRALVEHGAVRRGPEGGGLAMSMEAIRETTLLLPEAARSALAARIDGLAPGAREVAVMLAVARDPTELDVLVAASGLGEAAALAALDALLAAGIAVERRQDDREVVELAHARFRGVLLAGLDVEATRARHRALGAALEDRHRHAPSEIVEALASHFEEGRVASKAYAYLALTAFLRMKRRLYEEALGFLERAFAVEAEARLHLPLADADRRRAELGIARTRALYHLGRWEEAEAAGRQALGDAEALRDPALLARALTRLGYIQRTRGRLDEAEALLERALVEAQASGDPELRPRPLYHLGAIAWARGHQDAAEALWNEALTMARAGQVRRAEGMAHNGLGIVAASRGQVVEARRMWETAAEIFREVGMVDYRTFAEVNLAELLLGVGALHRVGQLADKALTRSLEVDHKLGICLAGITRARWLAALGRTEEAALAAEESGRLAEAIGSREERSQASLVVATARLQRGEIPAAVAAARQASAWLSDPDPEDLQPLVDAVLAQALAAAGEVDEAQARLLAAARTVRFPHVQVRLELERARAHQRLGEITAARGLAHEALGGATRLGLRFDALVAHDLLTRLETDPARREVHVRQARSLVRALAATLPRRDADCLLRRRWGEPDDAEAAAR